MYKKLDNGYHWFVGHIIKIVTLPIGGVDYELLLPQPEIKRLKMNIYWTINSQSKKQANRGSAPNEHLDAPPKLIISAEEIPVLYTELFNVGTYPPAKTKFTVPFDISDEEVVQKNTKT